MWSLLFWFLDYWFILVWVIGVIVAYIYGGKYSALVVATIGFGAIIYNLIDANKIKHAKEVQKDRENAYDEISKRDTNRDDVIDRLRKSGF